MAKTAKKVVRKRARNRTEGGYVLVKSKGIAGGVKSIVTLAPSKLCKTCNESAYHALSQDTAKIGKDFDRTLRRFKRRHLVPVSGN